MKTSDVLKIAALPGDGIGADVMMAAIPIFNALNIPVKLTFGDIGWRFWQEEGSPLPERTLTLIQQSDTALVGAITSKPAQEAMKELAPKLQQQNLRYFSPILQLRQSLDLFANVRPCFNVKDKSPFNFCVIRENTEGLYAGFDYHPIPEQLSYLLDKYPRWQGMAKDEVSCTLRLQTKAGLTRLFEFAFKYAQEQAIKRVTLADKPNIFRQSSAFVRTIFEPIASRYPHITADIMNVDAVALGFLRHPHEFGVVVAENMFGDILSDIGAHVMGGLGFAPSANIGLNGCYFEPVHGSGPRVGSNRANPSAMFLSISLLLKHFNYEKQSIYIRQAVMDVARKGQYVTYDLGGRATTNEMANAIIARCNALLSKALFL